METEIERKNLSIRPSADVHERLKEAAGWMGQTLQSFILRAALREADEVLINRDKIRITPEDAEMMIRLLDAEPEGNAALAAAFDKRAEVLGG